MTPPPLPAPVYDRWGVTVHHGCNQKVLPTLPANSVDAIVTDPPAGVAFMGRAWDSDRGGRDKWIRWLADSMEEAKRVLKPGGYGLVWALPRTSHWTAMALEDAGFEVRDCVTHLFAGGSFPKSLDVGKAIDKAAGAEREVVGSKLGQPGYSLAPDLGRGTMDAARYGTLNDPAAECAITAPATDAARQWQGWGTALAPKSEHWWLIRKPLAEGTVATNVLTWGVGGINIDGTRVGDEVITQHGRGDSQSGSMSGRNYAEKAGRANGRWPSNVLLSHDEQCAGGEHTEACPVAELDRQSGTSREGTGPNRRATALGVMNDDAWVAKRTEGIRYPGEGGASRFFPVFGWHEKATAAERPRVNGQSHNTVKAVDLMRWLVRLVTPPGGVVLDPFAGSGTTGQAARAEGMRAVLIEEDAQSISLIKARLDARPKTEAGAATVDDGEPADLLDLLGGESA